MVSPAELIRADVLALSAYPVPDASGMIKLDAMENPFDLPPALAEPLRDVCSEVALNRYPSPEAAALKARLRESMGIPDEMAILLGNGSDELIQIVTTAVAKPGAVILSVNPTFVMYRMTAGFSGVTYVGVDLNADFSLNLERMLTAIAETRPALIYLAYPNNPTGVAFPEEAVTAIVRAAPALVVIDEAYHAFAKRTFLDRLSEFPHMLVMRTVSKLGLAGARLGFLCGRPEWIDEFDKVRLPYNINVMTQRVVDIILANVSLLNAQAETICEARDAMYAALAAMPNVQVFRSDANFLLFRVPDAPALFESLKRKGILIKLLHGAHPLLEHCLRVSMGTPNENAQFLSALKESLTALGAH